MIEFFYENSERCIAVNCIRRKASSYMFEEVLIPLYIIIKSLVRIEIGAILQ